MASQSSSSTKDNQAPSLVRGQACITCRRKKMRCDGVRPFCGPCFLTRNPDHCEYTDKQGRTFTEVLEERLRLLRARITELEEREDDSPVLLRHPYSQENYCQDFRSMGSPALLSEGGDYAHIQPEISQLNQQFELRALIHTFLPHARRLHFVLHTPTFLGDIERPVDDPSYPHACIISAVALWALCIMGPNAEYSVHESHHLKLVLDALPIAHSSAVGRHRIQAIQAEILLALYLFNDARVTEGVFHLSAAGSGVLACGLHRIAAHQQSISLLTSLTGLCSRGLLLDPPDNSLEIGERILLFWTVYALDLCWSVALGSAPAISDRPTSGVSIRSPMPMPLDFYENVSIDEITSSEGLLVHAFINGSADFSLFARESSSVVAFVIGAALFERATRIATSSQLGDGSFAQEIEEFGRTLEKFNGALMEGSPAHTPSISTSAPGDIDARIRVLAKSLGWAAVIQLYFPFLGNADADERCRSAVREIVRLIKSDSEISLGRLHNTDFFSGIVWLSCARVVVNELATLSSVPATPQRDSPSTFNAMPDANEIIVDTQQFVGVHRAREIADDLETLLGAIRNLGETCPLIAHQLEVLEGTGDDESSS